MDSLDTVLLSAFPTLVVMCLLAVALPVARPAMRWAGVGLAVFVLLVSGLIVGLTHFDQATWDCYFGGIGAFGENGVHPRASCVGTNDLSLWLVALSPGLGIAVLLAWIAMHTRPAALALRTAAVLVGTSIGVVAIGQINANLALLLVVTMIAGSYLWSYVRDEMLPAQRVGRGT